jgi:hypothetical protein
MVEGNGGEALDEHKAHRRRTSIRGLALGGPESCKKSPLGMILQHGGRVLQIRSGDHGLA